MSGKPIFEPYDDGFGMYFELRCGWPTHIKKEDGAIGYCMDWAKFRVIFPSGGLGMFCEAHKLELEKSDKP